MQQPRDREERELPRRGSDEGGGVKDEIIDAALDVATGFGTGGLVGLAARYGVKGVEKLLRRRRMLGPEQPKYVRDAEGSLYLDGIPPQELKLTQGRAATPPDAPIDYEDDELEDEPVPRPRRRSLSLPTAPADVVEVAQTRPRRALGLRPVAVAPVVEGDEGDDEGDDESDYTDEDVEVAQARARTIAGLPVRAVNAAPPSQPRRSLSISPVAVETAAAPVVERRPQRALGPYPVAQAEAVVADPRLEDRRRRLLSQAQPERDRLIALDDLQPEVIDQAVAESQAGGPPDDPLPVQLERVSPSYGKYRRSLDELPTQEEYTAKHKPKGFWRRLGSVGKTGLKVLAETRNPILAALGMAVSGVTLRLRRGLITRTCVNLKARRAASNCLGRRKKKRRWLIAYRITAPRPALTALEGRYDQMALDAKEKNRIADDRNRIAEEKAVKAEKRARVGQILAAARIPGRTFTKDVKDELRSILGVDLPADFNPQTHDVVEGGDGNMYLVRINKQTGASVAAPVPIEGAASFKRLPAATKSRGPCTRAKL